MQSDNVNVIERFNLPRHVIFLIFFAAAAAVAILAYGHVWGSTGDRVVIVNDPRTAEIAVEIRGPVASPGVYRLDGDPRVADVIAAAGGTLPRADLATVNLAARVDDEAVVIIPEIGATVEVALQATPVASTVAVEAPTSAPMGIAGAININTADQAALESLPEIGPALAKRIIDYRTAHGPFTSIADLDEIDGISTVMVDDLAPLITIGP